MTYDLRCEDPETPADTLEDLYWSYFTATSSGLHPGCLAIAKNPNISRALLAKVSIHTMACATNPLLHLLLLEDPKWVRCNINPKIITLAMIHQQEQSCLN